MSPLLAFALTTTLAAAPDSELHHALWLEPVPLAAVGIGSSSEIVYLPIGVTLDAGAAQFTVETTVAFSRTPCDGSTSCASLRVIDFAVGWHRAESRASPMSGFFFSPKLMASHWRSEFVTFDGRLFRHETTGFDVGIGIDVGYQFRAGPLYIAPLIGAGVVACVDCGGLLAGPFFTDAGSGGTYTGPALTLNLNLLRVGGAF